MNTETSNASPVPAPADAPATSLREERHVLVVDDNRASRDMLVQLLRHFTSAAVVEAHNGDEALDLMRTRKPCLTFLDIDMPGKDGLSVLGEWRQAGLSPYVVMVTGLSAPNVVSLALERQVQGFIVKPYSPQRIVDALKRYAAQTRDVALLKRTIFL